MKAMIFFDAKKTIKKQKANTLKHLKQLPQASILKSKSLYSAAPIFQRLSESPGQDNKMVPITTLFFQR